MATKAVYIASGVAFAAVVLGFAGYKSIEARKSNDNQQLMATGSGALGANSTQNLEEGLPSGSSVGDGNTGVGPGNQPNTGSAMNGFNRGGMGSGTNDQPNRPRNNGSGGNGMGGRTPGASFGSPVTPGPGTGEQGVKPGNGNAGRPNGGQGRPPQGEMDFFGNGVMILADPKVQSELKLSAQQKAAIAQVMKPPQQGESGEDVGKQVQDYMSRAGEQGKKVKAILDDNQEKRYMQLVHQQMGPIMMLNGSGKEQFGVSDEEQKKFSEILTSFSAQFQKGMQGGQMPDMAAITKAKAQMDLQLIAALDEDSRNKWKAATGAPFKFSDSMGLGSMLGGMRRGGAPGGGGRRPGGK
jgi:hypothetical protein